MGCKYSRFRVPSKREKCPPRVEMAAGSRQTANAGNIRSRDPLSRSQEKNMRCLISLLSEKTGQGQKMGVGRFPPN